MTKKLLQSLILAIFGLSLATSCHYFHKEGSCHNCKKEEAKGDKKGKKKSKKETEETVKAEASKTDAVKAEKKSNEKKR